METSAVLPSKLGRLRELTDQLLSEESMIVTFFQLCPDMLCIINAQGHIVQVNDSWTDALGWTEDQLVSEYLIVFILPQDTIRVQHVLRSLKRSEKATFHCRIKKKSGEFVPAEWNAMMAEDGNIYASVRIIPQECYQCERVQQQT